MPYRSTFLANLATVGIAMKNSVVLLLTILCAGLMSVPICSSAEKDSWQPVSPEAVWLGAEKKVKSVYQECGSNQWPELQECFVTFMQKHGASLQAVAFAKLMDNTGYLRAFRKAGPVDIAYVEYPFRANTNEGYLLVNGDPPIVDVDNLELLKEAQAKSPEYKNLVQRFPNAAMWPGDRFHIEYPAVERLRNGGQRFIVDYGITDLCRACKSLGKAKFAFDFDANGKFLGVKMIGLEEIRAALKK